MKTTELIALQKSITQGEWTASRGETNKSRDIVSEARDNIATVAIPSESNSLGGWTLLPRQMEANAQAIALTPQLLAEVIRLREVVEAAEFSLSQCRYLSGKMDEEAGDTCNVGKRRVFPRNKTIVEATQAALEQCRTALENT